MNLVLVGCGAIAQAFYVPALQGLRSKFSELWLVDPSDRALDVVNSVLPGTKAHELSHVVDAIDAVIVATPNQLHFPVSQAALARGAHVLIEKPFVIWPQDGRALAQAASAAGRVIAINQTRRLHPLTLELRRRIAQNEFGRLRSIVHSEGTKLTWPFESGAGFAPRAQRTGVIMDFGVHVVDFYHWLFQPSWTLVSATHDGFDGPEGLAEIELEADGVPVSIRLSRYYTQENVAHLVFENAEVSFSVYSDSSYDVRFSSGATKTYTAVRPGPVPQTAAEMLLLNFLAACEGREPVICDAASSLPVIDILDATYKAAARYPATVGSV